MKALFYLEINNYQIIYVLHYSEVLQALPIWKDVIEKGASEIIGNTKVNLDHTECEFKECNIGNFYADAILRKLLTLAPYNDTNWSNISIAVVAAAEIPITLPKGDITYGQILRLCPFETTLVAFDLEGRHLKSVFEKSVSRIDFANNVNATHTFLQVAGLKIAYNLKNPVNQRVLQVKVRCVQCKLPIYEDLDENKIYRILANRFVANGGYGFSIFEEYGQNKQHYFNNTISIMEFVKERSPIYSEIEGRIKILNSE